MAIVTFRIRISAIGKESLDYIEIAGIRRCYQSITARFQVSAFGEKGLDYIEDRKSVV